MDSYRQRYRSATSMSIVTDADSEEFRRVRKKQALKVSA
jgi:hypothetical protein